MPRGRTRAFDADAALEHAVDLFARQGYEGTSIAQLTEAMGITPPSLYAAYGNKRQLFDLVIERYGEHRRSYMEDVMSQPTARLAAKRFLEGAAEHDTEPGQPRGCLTVQGCLAASPEDREVAETLARQRAANQDAIQNRLQQGVEDGDLPAGTNTAALARYVATVSQGISVQASGGASREQLLEVAELALAAIPEFTVGHSGSAEDSPQFGGTAVLRRADGVRPDVHAVAPVQLRARCVPDREDGASV
jgi:AcrR family transcriptional regulator